MYNLPWHVRLDLFPFHVDLDWIKLDLTDDPGADSLDITFSPSRDLAEEPGKEQSGRTNVVEDARYQSEPTTVYVIYSEVFGDSLHLIIELKTEILLLGSRRDCVEQNIAYSDISHVSVFDPWTSIGRLFLR